MRGISLTLILVIFALPTAANAFIIPGQIDDFQDGTLQTWGGNAAPINIATGGPAGAGDRYLQLTSAPPPGPGPKLGASNFVQWTGDYIAAGVTSIEADVINTSTFDLELRVIFPLGFGGDFTSTVATVIPNDGAWHSVSFGVAPADLTNVGGANNVLDTLQNVGVFVIRHQPGAPAGVGGSPNVTGSMGLDNIRAVPEPATLSMLLIGGAALLRRNRRNRS
ncbi:MAG: PEP-CTERM sorting domain-containing protein [Planctomycetota bacterium]|nr:PEP-CTERM sorting domain-containing protein [Planctomycetota bacterium]